MKRRIFMVLALLALTIAFVMPAGGIRVKAADKLMEKYFPNGIEKIKPYKPLIDIDENDTCWIGAIVKRFVPDVAAKPRFRA